MKNATRALILIVALSSTSVYPIDKNKILSSFYRSVAKYSIGLYSKSKDFIWNHPLLSAGLGLGVTSLFGYRMYAARKAKIEAERAKIPTEVQAMGHEKVDNPTNVIDYERNPALRDFKKVIQTQKKKHAATVAKAQEKIYQLGEQQISPQVITLTNTYRYKGSGRRIVVSSHTLPAAQLKTLTINTNQVTQVPTHRNDVLIMLLKNITVARGGFSLNSFTTRDNLNVEVDIQEGTHCIVEYPDGMQFAITQAPQANNVED